MIISFATSMLTLPNTTNAQENDAPADYRGTGQIATAQWIVGSVTIDAYFAEQLTTPSEFLLNGLYVKVLHGNGVTSADQLSLSNSEIVQNERGIQIETKMNFIRTGTVPTEHNVLLVWNFEDDAYITISSHPQNRGTSWSTTSFTILNTESPYASAVVTKDKGNTNTLKITVAEQYFDFVDNEMGVLFFSETFPINNNAAGTYDVHDGNGNTVYRVYVDTKGNDQIRECYIVDRILPANTNVSVDEPSFNDFGVSGSGQVAAAHWVVPASFYGPVTINAFFAEQLKTEAGIIPNGLYIKVHHGFGTSEATKSLSDTEISLKNSLITISVAQMAFSGETDGEHDIDIVWNLNLETAEITIGLYRERFHVDTYSTDVCGWAVIDRIASPIVCATVTKDKGNTNTLAIDVTAFFSDDTQITFKEKFAINNNAAGTYNICNGDGDTLYRVYFFLLWRVS